MIVLSYQTKINCKPWKVKQFINWLNAIDRLDIIAYNIIRIFAYAKDMIVKVDWGDGNANYDKASFVNI